MGRIGMWYRVYLEYFVKIISDESDYNIRQMTTEELEACIKDTRFQMSEKSFYYKAGMAAFSATDEAYRISGDDFNAAAGALCEFEDFIELVPEMV